MSKKDAERGCESMSLTEKQQRVLDFIERQIQIKGYPPSVREIGEALGLSSTATVHGYLDRLAKKGYLDKDLSKTRAIRVIPQDETTTHPEYIDVPIVGTVAAGMPILATENIEGYLPVTMDFASNHDLFVLRVKGESMINVGIFDGDLIIVNRCPSASNGEIVVALVEDEATVKTFYKEKDYFRLQPENDFMEPILVKSVVILGKVVGLFRKF